MKMLEITTFRIEDHERKYCISHINPSYVREVLQSKEEMYAEIHFNDGSIRLTESPAYLVRIGLQDVSEADKSFVILN